MFQSSLFRQPISRFCHPPPRLSLAQLWIRAPRPSFVSWRGLATKKGPPQKAPPRPSKPSSTSKPTSKFLVPGAPRTSRTTPGTYRNYAELLLRSKEPTLLYTLPKWTFYTPTTYGLTIFMATIGCWFAYVGYFIEDLKDDKLALVMSRIAGVLLVTGATYTYLTTTRRIRTVTAVPKNGKLFLRIAYSPAIPLPFRKQIVMTVNPKDVTLRTRLSDPRFTKVNIQEQTEKKEEAVKPTSLSSKARAQLSAISTKFSKTWFYIFQNTRRAWTREGFLTFKIAGKNGVWKLDYIEGMFKDGGKPLDQLVSYDFA